MITDGHENGIGVLAVYTDYQAYLEVTGYRGKQVKFTDSEETGLIDLRLGSRPYGPDAPRP
jgi:hypothetical protein